MIPKSNKTPTDLQYWDKKRTKLREIREKKVVPWDAARPPSLPLAASWGVDPCEHRETPRIAPSPWPSNKNLEPRRRLRKRGSNTNRGNPNPPNRVKKGGKCVRGGRPLPRDGFYRGGSITATRFTHPTPKEGLGLELGFVLSYIISF